MANPIVIDVDMLREAIPGLTESLAGYMQGAILMCLHHHSHQTGVRCELRDLEKLLAAAAIVWTKPYSDSIERTYGETSYAVEFAAEGIACLTIRAYTQYTVIRRSIKDEGVDFWLAERDDEDNYIFQCAGRMESKGITEARYLSDITYSIDKGIEQSKQTDHTRLPAYIIATEFSKPVIYMVQR